MADHHPDAAGRRRDEGVPHQDAAVPRHPDEEDHRQDAADHPRDARRHPLLPGLRAADRGRQVNRETKDVKRVQNGMA